MDLDGWVRHRATLMAASDAIAPAELRAPPLVFAPSPPLPGLSRLSAQVTDRLFSCTAAVQRCNYTWYGTLYEYSYSVPGSVFVLWHIRVRVRIVFVTSTAAVLLQAVVSFCF